MRRLVLLATLVVIGLGAVAVISPTPQAAAPCLHCPDVPIPSECPTCYQWVPETCRQCGHCERIKGCRS